MSRLFPALLALGLALPATALANPIAKSLGNLRWGLSENEVVVLLKQKARDDAEAAIKKGGSKASIERQLQRTLRSIEDGLVEFTGARNRWDSSSIKDQYTHENNEAMLVYDDGEGKSYYFFIEGSLWKWYKAYPTRVFGGSSFSGFEKAVSKKFGSGRTKQGPLYDHLEDDSRWVEFRDRNTRLRAVDRTKDGEFALIFEDLSTIRSLSALRQNLPKRSATARRMSAPTSGSVAAGSASKSEKGRRSILADSGGRGETQAEYEARKKSVIAAQKRKEKNIHERKEDRKKGQVLDTLAGIDDDDPISGMK